jgi:hypothetical protein
MKFELRNTPEVSFASAFQPYSFLTRSSDHRFEDALLEPEKRLMLAVLEDAIECFQDHYAARCGNSRRAFVDAERWIFGTNRDWVFGFENICSALGFDPEYVRKGLRRWREKEALKRSLASSGSTLGGEPAAEASKTLRVPGVARCPT